MAELKITTAKLKIARGISFFHGISVGSMGASIGFYMAYEKWWPMVASAGLICAIEIIINIARATTTDYNY